MMQINSDLKEYIENNVFPVYSKNEIGHGIEHIKNVINRSFELIEENKYNYGGYMNIEKISIKLLNEKAIVPTYGSEFSAGADLYANIDEIIKINPSETKFINTGISFEIPTGLVGLIYARSGLGCKKGLAPSNKVGVIDSDYRGEIIIALHNHSNETHEINPNDRIAQIVFTPYVKGDFKVVNELDNTKRGHGGFGSTG